MGGIAHEGTRSLQQWYNLIALTAEDPLLLDLRGSAAAAAAHPFDGAEPLALADGKGTQDAGAVVKAVQAWMANPKRTLTQWKYHAVVVLVDGDKASDEPIASAAAGALRDAGVKSVSVCPCAAQLAEAYPWLAHGGPRRAWPSEIIPGFLFLGAKEAAMETAGLVAMGITDVVSLLTEEEHGLVTAPESGGLRHHRFVIDDEPSEDLSTVLPGCLDALTQARAAGGRALVHCNVGRSRSAAAVIAYIMQDKGPEVPMERVLSFVSARRPCVAPNRGFLQQLRSWRMPPKPASAPVPMET